MLLRRPGVLVFSEYSRIGKYLNRYESDNCKGDQNKTDHSGSKSESDGGTACDVCRSKPCESNPSAPTIYDSRKYGHNLPCDTVSPQFETLPHIPTGIFRCTAGEPKMERIYLDSRRCLLTLDLKVGLYDGDKKKRTVKSLGRGADKCSCYQNPEYFSYHHMTYYDMHMLLRNYRKPSAESERKP